MQKKKQRPLESMDAKRVIDFSTALWHGADLAKLQSHLIDHIDLISQCPERSAETICRLLSRRIEVKEEELIVTNGSTGAMHLIARTFQGKKSMILTPTHIEIRRAIESQGHEVVAVDGRTDLSKLPLEGVDLCWICSPNTPDGRVYSRGALQALFKEHPQVVFIVDTSLAAFVVEETLKPNDIKLHKNVIFLSSFSKAYNISGMRIGYVVARKEIIKLLHKQYTPGTLSTLALEAARFILIHPAQFTLPVRKWLRSAAELGARLQAIDGIEVLPSSTPIFVVRLREPKAQELHDYLLSEHGIKVAIAAHELDLTPYELRINARDNEANRALVEAIGEWSEQSHS